MQKITRGIGEHGQEVMYLNGERILSISGLFRELGITPDFSKIPPELLARAIYVGKETHETMELFPAPLSHEDEDVQGCLNSFLKWFNSSDKIRLLKNYAERTEQDKINGVHLQVRIDNMFEIDLSKVVVDFKTGSKVDTNAKVQVTAQKKIFDADKGATLHLFKDGSIAKLEYWDEEELLNDMLAIYRDNDELDRVLKGQALFNDGAEIPKELAEEYAFVKQELVTMTKKEKELKAKIAKILGNSKGSYENDRYKLKFDFISGRESVKYDIAKMQEEGIDTEFYVTRKQGNGYYKTTIKEVKDAG